MPHRTEYGGPFAVEVIVVLGLACDEDIGACSLGLLPEEGTGSTTDSDTLDGGLLSHAVAKLFGLEVVSYSA